ncbi:MAG: hypothetical protein QOK43_282 [Acidimicrobiaceae bacterium]|nr:hypothetical protein [Acidimicrobiaceae bacterium]
MSLTLAAESWSCGARAALLFGTAAVAGACQKSFGQAKRTMIDTGGVGIVAFEKIGTWGRADPLIATWRQSGRGWRAARWSLVVDFFFLAAYGFGLWVLAAVVAQHARGLGWTGWAAAAAAAGLGFVVAAALDVVENVALLLVLHGNHAANWPGLARACASLKFLLLLAGGVVVATLSVSYLGP